MRYTNLDWRSAAPGRSGLPFSFQSRASSPVGPPVVKVGVVRSTALPRSCSVSFARSLRSSLSGPFMKAGRLHDAWHISINRPLPSSTTTASRSLPLSSPPMGSRSRRRHGWLWYNLSTNSRPPRPLFVGLRHERGEFVRATHPAETLYYTPSSRVCIVRLALW